MEHLHCFRVCVCVCVRIRLKMNLEYLSRRLAFQVVLRFKSHLHPRPPPGSAVLAADEKMEEADGDVKKWRGNATG